MGTVAKKEKKPTPCYIDFNLENNIFKISLNFCKGNKNRQIFEICVILFDAPIFSLTIIDKPLIGSASIFAPYRTESSSQKGCPR